MKKLEKLSVSNNLLRSIPPSFQLLKRLTELDLSNNQITEFPLALLNLEQLNLVDLSNNKITFIPMEAATLQATELNLNSNLIDFIAPELSQCPKLKTLKLEKNLLTLEAIPTTILTDSKVSLLELLGNVFDTRLLKYQVGHEKYEERFTEARRKLDTKFFNKN